MAYCTNCGPQLQQDVGSDPNSGRPAGDPSVPGVPKAPPAKPRRSKASVPGILLIVFGAILTIAGTVLWIVGMITSSNMEEQIASSNDRVTNDIAALIALLFFGIIVVLIDIIMELFSIIILISGIVLFIIGLVMLAVGVVIQVHRSLRLTEDANSLPSAVPIQPPARSRSRSAWILPAGLGEFLQIVGGPLCFAGGGSGFISGFFFFLLPLVAGMTLSILAVMRLYFIYRTAAANPSDAPSAPPRLKPLLPGILLFLFGEIMVLVSSAALFLPIAFLIVIILVTFVGCLLRVFGELFLYKHIPSDAANQ